MCSESERSAGDWRSETRIRLDSTWLDLMRVREKEASQVWTQSGPTHFVLLRMEISIYVAVYVDVDKRGSLATSTAWSSRGGFIADSDRIELMCVCVHV